MQASETNQIKKTKYRILAINPGSTSTKLAVYEDEVELFAEVVNHAALELEKFRCVIDQADFRMELVRKFLNANRVDPASIHAVIGRGGLLKPVKSGVYSVNQAMLDDLRSASYGEHASNLGAWLAHSLAEIAGCPAYIADPVVVDEMEDVARVSGLPEIERKSIFHALNQKSAAREVARKLGKMYGQCNFIVAHMGGGISVGAHRAGMVVDVNNALDGDGPFAPERSGGLPSGQLVELCFSGRYSLAVMKRKLAGSGGLMAFRGSNDFRDLVQAMNNGDDRARLWFEALAYQVAREIAMHGATLKGKVDRIILTGGLAGNALLVSEIRERVEYLAPIEIVAGEREMISLARAALAALRNQEPVREYA